eukprot:TRINITY_DN8534_c0_g1_i1.p1 TRINITY_DN8534_c0_g1~~TRINITY_DN8534_c0_g1_i1.p1  ORF type:complete len:79 (-),score=7.01 TRINITY_DN8534_c0_g1_i1:258-494(-)
MWAMYSSATLLLVSHLDSFVKDLHGRLKQNAELFRETFCPRCSESIVRDVLSKYGSDSIHKYIVKQIPHGETYVKRIS